MVYGDAPYLEALTAIVREHGTLYAWASSQPQPRALRGRAPVYVAQLPAVRTAVVVRHSWHGGLLAPLTRDMFRRPTRAPLEFNQSRQLRALAIPTTEVLGYALYQAPFGLARVDVVSRYVEHTADLGMVLANLVPAIAGDAALEATLTLLGQLARHGVVHPDLNVKNILLHTPSDAPPLAMVIDVDVATIGGVSPARAMARNLARLERSLHKWNRQFGSDVSDARIAAFAQSALARVPAASAAGDAS
jgi:tRNA A-37 threonylcarbamoyl transferase component Bud32